MVGIGQQEVYDFLTQHKGKWFTSRDISEQLRVSIGSVTMSLKKLRKTNLLKYKNTGVRNTFIYTVEPEGVTVAPPPGIVEAEEKAEERSKPALRAEKILPKMVVQRKSVPLVVAREEPRPAKKKAPKKAKTAAKKPVKKRVVKNRPAKKTKKPVKKSPKKATKRITKKSTKKPAKRTPERTKKTVKKAMKRPTKKAVKRPVKKVKKTAGKIVKKTTAKRPVKKPVKRPAKKSRRGFFSFFR